MSLDHEIYLTDLAKAILNSKQATRYIRMIYGSFSADVLSIILLMDRYPDIKTAQHLFNYFDNMQERDLKCCLADARLYDLIEIIL